MTGFTCASNGFCQCRGHFVCVSMLCFVSLRHCVCHVLHCKIGNSLGVATCKFMLICIESMCVCHVVCVCVCHLVCVCHPVCVCHVVCVYAMLCVSSPLRCEVGLRRHSSLCRLRSEALERKPDKTTLDHRDPNPQP